MLDFPITDGHRVSDEALRLGFRRFAELAARVQALPYGRPQNAGLFAVIHEQTGTCSSKHRLLAAVAHACGRSDIELIVGIYAMSAQNTPGVAAVLASRQLSSIPEAHCYLRVAAQRHDFTGLPDAGASPFAALLSEHRVAPGDLHEHKDRLHKAALRSWAVAQGLSPTAAWAVREACIAALSATPAQPRALP